MSENFLKKKCKPCEGGIPALTIAQAKAGLASVPGWQADPSGKSISIQYKMKHFMAAVACINAIARLAESEDHHPDLHLTGYRNLTIKLSTHAIGGLSENDFILAAKINEIPKELK
ncbi:MAG: 4a-hydroxytetrahydrobiopterin dehydratase [Candidatus Omnitrophica bacterium]|nr:4a-hydroxytetrahydrobiopterin dehydratase [Candidatus Omnitrophota bacterium]